MILLPINPIAFRFVGVWRGGLGVHLATFVSACCLHTHSICVPWGGGQATPSAVQLPKLP